MRAHTEKLKTQKAKLKSRRLRNPASWYITWLIIDAIVLAILSGFIFSLPIWQIKNVKIEGAEHFSVDKMIAIAQIPVGQNTFMVDLDEVKARFLKINQIKNISVHRHLPGTVIINITERKPFAIAVIGSLPVLVDDEGYIIAKQNISTSMYKIDIASFPVIRGIDKNNIEQGKRLGLSDRKFMKDTISLLSKFLDRGIQIEFANREDIIIYIEDIYKVKLGSSVDIEKKIKVLQAMMDPIKGKLSKVAYIDVRIPDDPVIKFK